jgi:hypothetical protein
MNSNREELPSRLHNRAPSTKKACPSENILEHFFNILFHPPSGIVGAMKNVPGILAVAVLAISLVPFAPARAGETNTVLFACHFERGLDGRWQQQKFIPGLALTHYAVVPDGTNYCLHASATNSNSALMAKLNLKPPAQLFIRWCWKIDHTPPGASDRTVRDYDHAARLIIAFDTFIGPPRSIDYLWANSEPIGTAMPHPLMGRAQMLVLESGNDRAGGWITEERDVTADWRRLFPGRAMPKIVGIGVLTDTDSTHTQVTADYESIELDSVR